MLEAQVGQITLKSLQNALEAPRTNPVMVLVVLLVLVLLVPFTAPEFFPAPAQEIFEPAPDFFWYSTRFLLEQNQMNFRNLRFTFDCDEATLLKLKSLSGKVHIQTKDFQSIISILINKTYETSKGKKL